MHTETRLENTGSLALATVLHSRCEAGPKHIEGSVVNFRSQDGKTVQRRLLLPGQEPSGSQWYAGSEQPDGKWILAGVETQIAVVNSFPKDQVSRCLLNWNTRAGNLVRMGLWSAKRTLRPGETLKLEADYEISPSRG